MKRTIRGHQIEFLERCGQGAAGIVWRAKLYDGGGWKTVAVKEYRGPNRGLHAETEARAMRLLKGRHVPALLDVDAAQGLLVMEFVDGLGLDELLDLCAGRNTTLPLTAVLRIGFEIAQALEAVHFATTPDGAPAGLVHLDIKPANILLERDGVRVVDFGIAAAQREVANGSGTSGYMAPEQRERGTVGAFTDIFALGRLLETLAGQQPELGRTSPHWGRCPELRQLIEEFTAAKPEDRPQNARSARRDLSTLHERLGGGLDSLRLVYSLSKQVRETQAAPLPEGDDWAAFVTAFTGVPNRKTAMRDATAPARFAAPPSDGPGSVTDVIPDPSQAPPRRGARRVWLLLFLIAAALLAPQLWDRFRASTFPPSADVAPQLRAAQVGGNTGVVRVHARYPFELRVGAERYPGGDAERGLTLAVGVHEAVALCLECPAGLATQVPLRLEVRAGETHRVSVRFPNTAR